MSDFMPLDGWDHVELWVGNAKQAAYFYEHAFGFTRSAYSGPETGVRDRASYVLEQGDIRLVVTSAEPTRPEAAFTSRIPVTGVPSFSPLRATTSVTTTGPQLCTGELALCGSSTATRYGTEVPKASSADAVRPPEVEWKSVFAVVPP